MKKSDALKQERAGLNAKQQALIDLAKSENRNFTEQEEADFDSRAGEIRALDIKIDRAVEIEMTELRTVAATANVVPGASTSEERELNNMKKRYSIHNVIRSQMTNGVPLSGIELEIHQETKKQAERSGVAISGVAVPLSSRADGQTVGEDSGAYGGNLVANELQDPIEYLRPKPILESLGARMLTGLQGNLVFPTNDGGIAGAWEGEVDTNTNSKNAYGSKTMSPKRYSASVLISLQNLMQTNINLEMYTMDELRAIIANAIDSAGINGSGAAPIGILNTVGVGSVVGGTNGAVPTWAHLVGMETAVEVANANSARLNYLINPGIKGKLKQTAHATNSAEYLMHRDGTVNGYNAAVSNLVPSNLTKGTASGICSAGIFGDFSQLLIGQWAFLDLSVDDKSKKKDGYVEVTANTFLDILVRQPKAFTVVKDWLTA